jgi:hypothetical protein
MLYYRVYVGYKAAMQYLSEDFVCHVQEAYPSIVFTIEFIALLEHWTQYSFVIAFR